jgi:hypothetical protein
MSAKRKKYKKINQGGNIMRPFLGIVAATTLVTLFAGPASAQITGCLTPGGTLVNVVPGEDSDHNCRSNQTLVILGALPDAPPGAAGSTVYTRWGRNDCPLGANLLYGGVAGGGNFGQPGSGANLLCLSAEPDTDAGSPNFDGGALLYAATYQGTTAVPEIDAVLGEMVPCAVCERTGAAISIMQPGRDLCPASMNLEYPGFLMGPNFDQDKGEYVCVDQSPQSAGPGALGHLLYTTEAGCFGSNTLCDFGYAPSREVTCSVCTK